MGTCRHPQQQSTLPELHPPTPSDRNYDFEGFILEVYAEDNRIEIAATQGKVNSVVQTNYSAVIGIGKDEAQTMLTIVRAANLRLREMVRQKSVIMYGLQSSYPNEHPDPDTLQIEWDAVVQETVDELRQQLDEESFNKLEAFVRHPHSLSGTTILPPAVSDPDSCSKTPTKGVIRFTNGGGYATLYEFEIGRMNDYNLRQNSEEDKRPIILPSVIHPSEDEREAVITIALNANRQIRDNYSQFITAGHEVRRKNYEMYGAKAYSMPDPPEVVAIFKRQFPIIEDSIAQLRNVLGDETFRALDRYVYSTYEGGHFESVSDQNGRFIEVAVRCTFKPNKQRDSSAPAQTTGAQHD